MDQMEFQDTSVSNIIDVLYKKSFLMDQIRYEQGIKCCLKYMLL